MSPAPLLFCLVLCAASMPAQVNVIPPGTPNPEGSIEGTVINEVTREPIRKAQVVAGSTANVPPAVTDSNGRFAFRNLATGTYWLQAQHPEFPQAMSGLTASSPVTVDLAHDEQKRDVVISLAPGSSISGRILNEDRKPVTGCYAQALQFAPGQSGNRLYGPRGASSDDRGEYRIYGLTQGHYYVSVQCNATVPVAHPFVRRGSDVDVPQQRYATEFYPDSPDFSSAARMLVAAGADVRGIDFHLHATTTINVRGRLTGDPEALSRNPRVELLPRDPSLSNLVRYAAASDAQTGVFRIQAVPAGAYTLVATAQDAGLVYQAKAPLDIEVGAPQRLIELPLNPAAVISGSIEIESDAPAPLENLRVSLTPVDSDILGQSPNAKVDKDGTFSLSAVLAGRWRLDLAGLNGYVKSLSLGGQEVSPNAFDVLPGANGAMRIVVGTKMAQVEGTVSGSQSNAAYDPLVIMASEDADGTTQAQVRTMPIQNGRFSFAALAPGHYRLYAVAAAAAGALQQNPRVLKAMETRGTRVELAAGGRATVQVEIISMEELRQTFQEIE
jgi:hypothetical protein